MNEMDGLKESNKKVLADHDATLIQKNTSQKELDELRVRLSNAEKKVKSLKHKL